jgi:alpha-methylacyl-CoA racemase
MAGPLRGTRIIELAGIGPAPFCAMLLGDLGAEVIRVDRPPRARSGLPGPLNHLQGRNKRSIAVDLKHPDGRAVVLDLVASADVLIEGYRPGVAERLGLGPEECRHGNPRLVYGRMTGWGRGGPLSPEAGHDINYIGLVGALHSIGSADGPPTVPLNLVGDYGGGSLYLAMGILAALVARERTGQGDVVDAAMVDGAASLMLPTYEMLAHGAWQDRRAGNLLDGGAPFYDTYEAADGRFLAVGPIEQKFFAALLAALELDPSLVPDQYDPGGWDEMRATLARCFRSRPRDEWVDHFAGSDACVTPVLSLAEAPGHPHNVERETFIEVGGIVEPAPAPRFESAAPDHPAPARPMGADTRAVLHEIGRTQDDIARLIASGAVHGPPGIEGDEE